MKVVFITSTIVSLIVIISLVLVNVLSNTPNTNGRNTNDTGTNGTNVIDTNSNNTSINANSTNVIDTTSDKEKSQIFKCNIPFYVNKIIVYYSPEHVDKIDLYCINEINIPKIIKLEASPRILKQQQQLEKNKKIVKEYINKVGFTNIFIKKSNEQIQDFIIANTTNSKNTFLRYTCPNSYKISGLVLNKKDLDFSIICIQ